MMKRYIKIFSDFLKEKKSMYFIISVLVALLLIITRMWYLKKIKEDDISLFYEKAELFMNQKKFKESIPEFEKCVKGNWKDWLIYYHLGYCYYLIGDNSKSTYYFHKSMDLNPTDSETKGQLALTLAEIPDKLDGALEKVVHIEESEKLKSIDNWRQIEHIVTDIKGWILLKMGEKERAIEIYEEIIPKYKRLFETGIDEYDFVFSDTHYHFGIIFKFKGEIELAKSEFKKSIKAGGPQSIFAKKSKEELEKLERIE